MPESHNEITVSSNAVSLAVADYGGDGPPVLLLHGVGANLLSWDGFAPLLTGSHRVIAVDLRGHARSGDGPWQWEAVLDDLEAVAKHFALDEPAVVGQSLGGMLAAMWARRRPGCPAAVSFDGHRSATTRLECYSGMPADRLRADLARLNQMFDAQAAMHAQPLTDDQLAALGEQQRAVAAQRGLDARAQADSFERGLAVRDGQTFLRPGADVLAAIRSSPEFVDCLPVIAEVAAPFLAVLATQDPPSAPTDFSELMDAYRAGLRRDFAEIAARRPTVAVRKIDAGHDMIAERPGELAELTLDFLRRAGTA
ncbi:MAG: alpha/beta fold hydrolase [Stackebrandtia sp.]